MNLDLQLKQFGAGFAERTTMLVAGYPASGKTMFCTWVAARAAAAGLKVAYIEGDHSFDRGVISVFITELLAKFPEQVFYSAVLDKYPYDSDIVDRMVQAAVEAADVIILDELPRIYSRAEDAGTAPGWKAAVKLLNQGIKNEQLRSRRAVVSYSARDGRDEPIVITDEQAIPGWQGMGSTVTPVVTSPRDAETHLMTVEILRTTEIQRH